MNWLSSVTIGAGLTLGIALVAIGVRKRGVVGIELVVLASGVTLALVGLVAVLAGVFDMLVAAVVVPIVVIAAAAIARGGSRAAVPPPAATARPMIGWLGLAVVLVGAAALRWPPTDPALAGRDPGTYALRAAASARTGGFDLVDTVVRDTVGPTVHAHAIDVASLYPERNEPWREDVYEAGYRPGWYLADRETGRVVPQFLHLHPALGTVATWIAGSSGIAGLVVLEGLLCVLALFAVARRVLPRGWALLAAATYAASPLVVWVHRNPLTEALTGFLLLAAVLAFVRARDDGRPMLVLGALLLASTAWIRGNAWLTAPVVLAMLWLVPRGPGRGSGRWIFILGLAGSVVVHAFTVFPYLHDEFARQLTAIARPSPWVLVFATAGGVLAWWSVDEIGFGERSPRGPAIARVVLRATPVTLVVAAGAAIALWWWRAAAAHGDAPWSRLDALVPGVGLPLLLVAAVGLGVWVARGKAADLDEADVWIRACGAAVVATLVLYAGRNLPRFGLYYYGRYLVPEVAPVVCLAAAYGLAAAHDLSARALGRRVAAVIAAALALALLGATVWPLIVAPATRLRELAGADRFIDALADRVPEGAVVIAGGEGWHYSHTFNQVAGALAMRHGTAIVPYSSREAAYATMHHLLVDRADTPRRVFLLLNEASHVLARDVRGAPIALLDDALSPPFAAASVATFELVTDRLTPTFDQVPTAVTRDWLRMALVEVVVAPADDATTIAFAGGEVMPEGVVVERSDDGCVSPERPLVVRLDAERAASVAAVVVVAASDDAATAEGWQVEIDGVARPPRSSIATPRHRQTLGPFAVHGPRVIAVSGATKPDEGAACPHGSVEAIRLLGPERHALDDISPDGIVVTPEDDLGHPVAPAVWVAGRGLSRFRPQLLPAAPVRANAILLSTGAPISFADEPLGVATYDVVINTTETAVSPSARIRVLADDRVLGEIDPPDARDRSWQSPPLVLEATTPVVRWRLELVGGDDDDTVGVRDLGAFARSH